jgi:NADPH:quinone reductase-like Zn-dependent oxidoreductase
MKAVVLSEYGDIQQLVVRDVAEPTAGPGEIKVKMAGASINPIDWKLRGGALRKMIPLTLPAILGRDASGVVTEVGPGVTAFQRGDRVMGLVNQGYAEQIVGPVGSWARVPAGMDLAEAGALPLVLLTGAQLVEEAANVREGEVVLVTGATGSVGRAAVFAAKARGAQVWAGVRGKQRAEAESLGANGVVALDNEADIGRLPLLDRIADTVGGDTIKQLFRKVKVGGTIGSVVGEPDGAREDGLVPQGMITHPDSTRLAALAQAVADGALVIPIAKKFPLDQAREAQTLAERGAGGKVLLLG